MSVKSTLTALVASVALIALSGCASTEASSKTLEPSAPVGSLGPMPEANSSRSDLTTRANDKADRIVAAEHDRMRVRVNEVCLHCR